MKSNKLFWDFWKIQIFKILFATELAYHSYLFWVTKNYIWNVIFTTYPKVSNALVCRYMARSEFSLLLKSINLLSYVLIIASLRRKNFAKDPFIRVCFLPTVLLGSKCCRLYKLSKRFAVDSLRNEQNERNEIKAKPYWDRMCVHTVTNLQKVLQNIRSGTTN